MIRIGIIGAGPNAVGHAQYYAHSSRSRVVAIADPDQQRATALARELEAESVSDYHEFLDKVDAVIISSPNFLHREHAIICAEAGKHIYCEKPMGLSLLDARAIAEAVKRTGVKSTVGFTVRFESPIQTIQHLAEAGELGQMLSLCSRRLFYFDPAHLTGWRKDSRLSGGLLMEISLHELDWMMALGGDVSSVYARTWAAEVVDERSNDHIWVTLNFANGAVGLHEGSWLSPTPAFYRNVQGTSRGLQTDEWGSKIFDALPGKDRVEREMDSKFDLEGHFLDCIEERVQPVADVAWGVKVMTVAEAVVVSAAQKRVVAITELS